MPTPTSQVLTGMILDWAGSTRLHEDHRLGGTSADRAATIRQQVKKPFDDLVRQILDEARGEWVHTTGDGACCVFEDPQQAVLCALVFQWRLQHRPIPIPGGVVQARIGLHTEPIPGDAIRDQYIHQAGNYAARAQSLAPLGGVAVTETVHALCQGKIAQVTFTDLGKHELKKGEGSRPFYTAHCPADVLARLSDEWHRVVRDHRQPENRPPSAATNSVNITNTVGQGVIGPVSGNVHFHAAAPAPKPPEAKPAEKPTVIQHIHGDPKAVIGTVQGDITIN